MNNENREQAYRFINGGGEMGELTRSYDWATTSLGLPETWPKSLCTTLGIILHSQFPMFLFWGPDLICFYNDAYRPSLGTDGKHPALGKYAKEVWPEIWHFIGPLIEKVLTTGESQYFDDQLLPIYRNGKMEDVYWSFSYSAAYTDDGTVHGVFVTCTETTGKVFNRKALEESEQRFRTMAEGTEILIAVGDETSNATYFNKAWSDLTGRPATDLLKFGWLDLVHPDDRDRYVNIYLDAFKLQQPFTGEFRVMSKKGDYRWLLATGPPRFRADGSFAGYISASIDITERKASELRFRDTEQRLRSVIESAPFPIGIYVGREMRIQFANPAILEVWGKGNDVIGKLYSEILPELDNQLIFSQLDQVYTTGIPFHARNQRVDLMVEARMQSFYFNYSFTPVLDSSGAVYGVMNTAAEVTDLNVAKLMIEQSERNIRNMVLQAPVAMCILMGEEHIVDIANDMMIALWGKPAFEVMHRPIFEGLPDAKGQGLEKLLHDVFTSGQTFKANEMPVNLFRNGKTDTVYQNFVYEPYRDSGGEILGVLAITNDVTEQVIARLKIEEVVAIRTEELATVNNNLQRSNADLAQFAYIASHDLQEPVRKVSTFTNMLESHLGETDERTENYIGKIKKSAARMLDLIRGVLSYSELSGMNMAMAPVNLQKVVNEVISDLELIVDQKKAVIVSSGLPQIEAIPLHMSQLFANLISNALKFDRPGVNPEISVTSLVLAEEEQKEHPGLDPRQRYYKITVEDNGIGFEAEYSTQIFSIFQRLHGRSEYEGTGIGLAMCQKIVQNHHGEIHALSEAGKGSAFIVILPERQNQ